MLVIVPEVAALLLVIIFIFIGATESDLFLSLASKGALNGPILPYCWQFYPCFS